MKNVLKPKPVKTKVRRATKPLHQSDVIEDFINQRMVEDIVVKFGLAADIPDGSTHCKAYFATDTGALSMWDGSAWLSTTLS